MKTLFHKVFSSLGTFVLGVLGFTSCDGINGIIDGPILCEYGTPHGEFKVDIRVTDESGSPLKDIHVSPVPLHPSNYDIRRQELETIKTDASGKAVRTYHNSWIDDVRVIFEDTTGVYAKDSADFKPVQTKEGDNHWYRGEKTVSGTQKLKKK